eukprot:15243503-Ditylum_brightwellii.AAC.1
MGTRGEADFSHGGGSGLLKTLQKVVFITNHSASKFHGPTLFCKSNTSIKIFNRILKAAFIAFAGATVSAVVCRVLIVTQGKSCSALKLNHGCVLALSPWRR